MRNWKLAIASVLGVVLIGVGVFAVTGGFDDDSHEIAPVKI